jgi:DNA-binding response OmpR family regulator
MVVSHAETLDEAVAVSEKILPHLVIISVQMSDNQGLKFLEMRRNLPNLHIIPVIVLSSEASKDAIYDAMSLGADDYVGKPISAAVLLQKIRRLMKDRKFCTVVFPEGQRPKIKATIRGTITRASEVGFIVESTVKLAPDQPVEMRSAVLEELAVSECLFQTASRSGPLGGNGLYLNRVVAVGLSEPSARQIRKTVMHWK